MKKLLCLLVALVLTIAVVGCSDFSSTVTDYSGTVSSNGGFAVQKGEYVYLINGYDVETADNTFGKVVHGAIIRVKAADLGKDDVKAEVVVPKLVHTEYTGAGSGIFIAGDYVYYPTTNDQKGSTGAVKYSEEVFMRTKLDASESSVITIVDTHDVPYRFFEKAGKVYLTIYTSVTEDDTTSNYLVTYDETGKEVGRSKKISGYDLGEFGSEYAYYTHTAYNETLEQDESFNQVYRYSYTGSSDAMILNGVGGYNNDGDNGIGTQGVTFSIVKNASSALFVSMTYVDTSVATCTRYYGLNHSDINAAGDDAGAKANYDAMTLLNDGDGNATTVFASDAIYVAKNCIIYSDASYGIVKYDYNDRNTLSEGLSYLFKDEDLMSYTYEYKEGNYLYYSDSDNYYYRLDLSELVDLSTGATKEGAVPTVERLTYTTTYTPGEWFNPEYVGDHMLYLRAGEPYEDYVYCVGLKDFEDWCKANDIADPDDDDIEDYVEELNTVEKRSDIEAKLKKRIGILSDADAESLESYLDNNYSDEE